MNATFEKGQLSYVRVCVAGARPAYVFFSTFIGHFKRICRLMFVFYLYITSDPHAASPAVIAKL